MCKSHICSNTEGGNSQLCPSCQGTFDFGDCVNIRCTNRRVASRKDGLCQICHGKIQKGQCVGREDCFKNVVPKGDTMACDDHQNRLTPWWL